MGAIKKTPDNVAPGNGPKYSVITIGVSIGAQASRRPGKPADRLFFGPAELLPIAWSFCVIIYFFSMSNYVG
ncbi:hypothetical protein ACSJLX_002268 [Serratia marcescens]